MRDGSLTTTTIDVAAVATAAATTISTVVVVGRREVRYVYAGGLFWAGDAAVAVRKNDGSQVQGHRRFPSPSSTFSFPPAATLVAPAVAFAAPAAQPTDRPTDQTNQPNHPTTHPLAHLLVAIYTRRV